MTHEQFIHAVRELATSRIMDEVKRQRLLTAKLTYGSGPSGHRGICFFAVWEQKSRLEFIEICANGEVSTTQLAGTTIHELAHCLAGPAAGHGRAWRSAARSLGLVRSLAADQAYCETDFEATLWDKIVAIASPTDGRPAFRDAASRSIRACPVGAGTRGGKSRGPGSGSRLRLFVCDCNPPIRVRVARDEDSFSALCLTCGSAFKRATSDRAVGESI